jgi:hypothetical protein
MVDAAHAPSLQERLASLRASGAWRVDAARFGYLEALARRMPSQPAPVRQRLQEKLEAGLSEFTLRVQQQQPPARRKVPAPTTPLAQLNAYLRSLRAASHEGQQRDELASARAFRQAWEKTRALEQVQQALARKPANAGPLNSHALVLRSLDVLRELSPDYLRRFVSQVEALQWLEQARENLPKKAGRGGRKKK